MQRTRKATDLLLLGVPPERWMDERLMVKGGLQSRDMSWGLTTRFVSTAHAAVAEINSYVEIELVVFSAETLRVDGQLRRDAREIAEAIRHHEHAPWVSIPCELSFLAPVLVTAGVHVEQGMLLDAVYRRWLSQSPNTALRLAVI